MGLKTAITAILSLVFATVGPAQESSQFAGHWQARIGDSVACTIRFTAGEKLSGAMSDCHVNVDSAGNLIEPEPSDSTGEPTPIVQVRFEKGILTFATKDNDDADAMEFEMRLLENDVAQVRVLNPPVKIKPIRFTRLSR